MSRIATSRARRETSTLYRGRPLIVTVGTHELEIREKGRHSGFQVPYLVILQAGQKIAALEARREKLKRSA